MFHFLPFIYCMLNNSQIRLFFAIEKARERERKKEKKKREREREREKDKNNFD